MNIFDNDEELDFINDLMKGNKVILYKKTDNSTVDTEVKLLDLNNLSNYSNEEIQNFLDSEQLTRLTKQLTSAARWAVDKEKIQAYDESLKKYKNAIKSYIDSTKFMSKDDKGEGEGIKKRNGYEIVDSKYNKLLINMDKLYNNYYVEARLNNDIIYENQGDKDTVELLTKGRINKKKKYSKLSQQIFNDMITLSGMIKKRNSKSKLIGSSNIIFNDKDLQKRMALLRGSIIAGNDNPKLLKELSELTNQENIVQNKSVNDLYNNLKTLTPMLKTSQGNANVYNNVYNIIDYLRTNRHITRDQYHKFIKKHLM